MNKHRRPHSIETKRKIGLANSIALKGHVPWNKGKRGVMPTPWNKGIKTGIVPKTAFKKGRNKEKCWNWKGGISPENVKIRSSIEYKLWRKACIIRDNFTCQKSGIRGGRLTVHHINNFSEFKELRLSIDNGITLSIKAHDDFHKIYGRKNNTKEQIIEFINKK
jgi:hypothetical protein